MTHEKRGRRPPEAAQPRQCRPTVLSTDAWVDPRRPTSRATSHNLVNAARNVTSLRPSLLTQTAGLSFANIEACLTRPHAFALTGPPVASKHRRRHRSSVRPNGSSLVALA